MTSTPPPPRDLLFFSNLFFITPKPSPRLVASLMRSESRSDTACRRPPEGSGGNVCLQTFNPGHRCSHQLEPSAAEVTSSINFLFPEDWSPAPSDPRHSRGTGSYKTVKFLKDLCVFSLTSCDSHFPPFIGSSLVFAVFAFLCVPPRRCFRGLHFSRVLLRHVRRSLKKQKTKRKEKERKNKACFTLNTF